MYCHCTFSVVDNLKKLFHDRFAWASPIWEEQIHMSYASISNTVSEKSVTSNMSIDNRRAYISASYFGSLQRIIHFTPYLVKYSKCLFNILFSSSLPGLTIESLTGPMNASNLSGFINKLNVSTWWDLVFICSTYLVQSKSYWLPLRTNAKTHILGCRNRPGSTC